MNETVPLKTCLFLLIFILRVVPRPEGILLYHNVSRLYGQAGTMQRSFTTSVPLKSWRCGGAVIFTMSSLS